MYVAPIGQEIRKEILEKIKNGERVVVVAKQYGVSDKTIHTWLRRQAIGTVSLVEYNKIRSENEQLKQIIGVLTLELQKTKKKK